MNPKKACLSGENQFYVKELSWIHSRHSRYVSLLGSRNRFPKKKRCHLTRLPKEGWCWYFFWNGILPLRKRENPKNASLRFCARYRRAAYRLDYSKKKSFFRNMKLPFSSDSFSFSVGCCRGISKRSCASWKMVWCIRTFYLSWSMGNLFPSSCAPSFWTLYSTHSQNTLSNFSFSHRNRNPSRRKIDCGFLSITGWALLLAKQQKLGKTFSCITKLLLAEQV